MSNRTRTAIPAMFLGRRGPGRFAGLIVALWAGSTAARLGAEELDTRPWSLPVAPVLGQVEWSGWHPVDQAGVARPLRPILVTHAGDGSGRLFVPTQRGVIYALDKDQSSGTARVFLDIESLVAYDDQTNEEGLLGLAFHPGFRENGQFVVYYTNRHKPHQNVVARYKVDPRDPRRADPESAEILLVLDKPFWNHDGGTVVFGPDGYLYIAVGDGGAANDPFQNGQKLASLLGKILRIDVDRREGSQPYAVPSDNPFVGQDGARPEIWAWGLRNVWRMAFDRETSRLWAADVGQDVWEEINLIERGGNYGWNRREGFHPFVKKGGTPPTRDDKPADVIDPIFEYHHDLGKSITGGVVYRGRAVPELVGHYLYADYVAGRLWALHYDEADRRVTSNREIPLPASIPILSFGEDEAGEVYFTTFSSDGRGIWRFGP